MKPSEILNAALELMSEGWCQFHWAQDASGLATGVRADDAARFCSFGAVQRICIATEIPLPAATYYLHLAAHVVSGGVLTLFGINDRGTALDVGRMFIKAIQLAEADGQ